MTDARLDPGEIQRIRAYLQAEKAFSRTTQAYQDQVLSLVGADAPGDVVEIGCFMGGLTAQLAYACQVAGRRLAVVDIDRKHLDTAFGHLKRLSLDRHAVALEGDFRQLCATGRLPVDPFLFVVDGDHRYAGVVSDLKAILTHFPGAAHAVFHDFSLRYDTSELSNVRVDRALRDTLGTDFSIEPFGTLAKPGSGLRLKPMPTDPHYHEQGQPEAALISIPAAVRATRRGLARFLTAERSVPEARQGSRAGLCDCRTKRPRPRPRRPAALPPSQARRSFSCTFRKPTAHPCATPCSDISSRSRSIRTRTCCSATAATIPRHAGLRS